MVSYLDTIGVARSTVLTLVLVFSAVNVVCILAFAGLSDRLGGKKVLLAAAVAAMILAFPVFALLDTGTVLGILVGLLIAVVVIGALYGPTAWPTAASFAEMFCAEIRYSGASVGYQLGAVIGGGFAPLIAPGCSRRPGRFYAVAAFVAVARLMK